MDTWIRAHGGGYRDRFQTLTRLTEERGDAAALQRRAGLRPA